MPCAGLHAKYWVEVFYSAYADLALHKVYRVVRERKLLSNLPEVTKKANFRVISSIQVCLTPKINKGRCIIRTSFQVRQLRAIACSLVLFLLSLPLEITVSLFNILNYFQI
jgi:hypothetical protein